MKEVYRDREVAPSLGDLQRELAALEVIRDNLQREHKMFRRLGFSTERIKLRLLQVDARRARCEEALRRCRAVQEAAEIASPGAR